MKALPTEVSLTWDSQWTDLQRQVGKAVAGGADAQDMQSYLAAALEVAGPDRHINREEGAILAQALDTWSGDKTLHEVRKRLGRPDPHYQERRPLDLSPLGSAEGVRSWNVMTLQICRALGLEEVPVAGHPRQGMV